MNRRLAWLNHLIRRRSGTIFHQTVRMYRFHRKKFEDILSDIVGRLERYGAHFTFPTVASVAVPYTNLLKSIILSTKNEIASHGYTHTKYLYLSPKQERLEIKRSLVTFQRIGIKVNGYRAPFNSYTTSTPQILEDLGFIWDIGIGYQEKYCNQHQFFHIMLKNVQSSFVCVPLSRWSDDLLIDRYRADVSLIVKLLKKECEAAKKEKGIVMFDLHPIRLGQDKYLDILDGILTYGEKTNGWFPTVTEAVLEWKKGHIWPFDFEYCCLLTGDIDNFTFWDYLRRLL
ncbi:MAG: polysaccharide deacetylase family protein [Promethearchaeota archaeon]